MARGMAKMLDVSRMHKNGHCGKVLELAAKELIEIGRFIA
jgi:hypothetical protein